MLSKKNRLASERDFSKLFAKGKSVSGKGVGFKFVRNTVGNPRIGFVVSTKISKRAVERNLIKRRMREAVRQLYPGFSTAAIDGAFIARSEALKMTYTEIFEAIKAALIKAGLLNA